MILGVGAGWMAEEFEAVDVGMDDRFSRMDEHVALMRAAWQQGVSEHHGRFYSHVKAGFGPQPPVRATRSRSSSEVTAMPRCDVPRATATAGRCRPRGPTSRREA